jgi:hypothetical protein
MARAPFGFPLIGTGLFTARLCFFAAYSLREIISYLRSRRYAKGTNAGRNKKKAPASPVRAARRRGTRLKTIEVVLRIVY